MVDTSNGLMGILPKISSEQLLSWSLWGGITILAISLIGFLAWYFIKRKKYSEFRVEILERDINGNVHKIKDRAGIFKNKEGIKLFWLERAKIGMNPNKIPYISDQIIKGVFKKHKEFIKTVYMRKTSEGKYVFIELRLSDKVEFTLCEEDLNNVNAEMAKIRRSYSKPSLLDKILAPMIFVITIVIIMVILISLVNKFTILESISENLKGISEQQLTITERQLNITQLLVNQTIDKNMGYATIIEPTKT